MTTPTPKPVASTHRADGGAPEIEAYFRGLVAIHQGAWVADGGHVVDLNVDGLGIRLRFTSPALWEAYRGSLGHLSSPLPRVDLTLLMMDGHGCSVPAPHWQEGDYALRGELPRLSSQDFFTTFNIDSGVLNMLDRRRSLGVHWVRTPSALPQYELGAPLRDILSDWMTLRERQLIHAGALGHPQGGVLLLGPGGSGKSSTAAACLGSPLGVVSDDYCLVDVAGEAPRAIGLFSTLKLFESDDLDLPGARALPSTLSAQSGKRLYHLGGGETDCLLKACTLRSLLICRVGDTRETYISKATKGEVLRAMAPSTLLQLPGAGHRSFEMMASLVRTLPCFSLHLGHDRGGVVSALAAYLEPWA